MKKHLTNILSFLFNKNAVKILLGFVVVGALSVGVYTQWQRIWVETEHLIFRIKYRRSEPPDSRIEVFSFYSAALKVNKEVRVYLPSMYELEPEKQFPSLYLLHGFPGSNQDWLVNGDTQRILDQKIKEKKLPQMIAIFPDGKGPHVDDGEYINATEISQPMEDYMLEVVQQVDQKYRTIQDKNFRAIGGLSTGGYAAVNLGLKHQDIFGQMISHSGYFDDKEWVLKKLYGDNQDAKKKNDPLSYIGELHVDEDVWFFISTGSNDFAEFLRQNQAFKEQLEKKGLRFVYETGGGLHAWLLWKGMNEKALDELGKIWSELSEKYDVELMK